MINVTPGGGAYRFGPHGMVFKKPVRLELPVDEQRLPSGFTANDIRTFYYSESLHRWEQVGFVSATDGAMLAASDHFTDFINATIATPDHPGTQSLNPTSIKDIKLADPAAGITQIEPPTADNTGSAKLRYPIEIPQGRRGMQPQLALTYDSDRGNGWLGLGWDLGISAIEIDTRFGVPRYDRSERYLLDGAELTPVGGPSNPQPFVRRVEGSFDRILRHGDFPAGYTWQVTDRSGTSRFYGQTAAARLSDPSVAGGNIARWQLEREVDPFGNEVNYFYQPDPCASSSAGCTNGAPYTQLYPARIEYTKGAGLAASYSVVFTLDSMVRDDAFSSARFGFQVLTQRVLQSVRVLYGSTLIRRYDFAFRRNAGGAVELSLGKMLLDSVALTGQDGSSVLYRHAFGYSAPPTGAEFAPVQVWGEMKHGDATRRDDMGLTSAQSKMSGLSGRWDPLESTCRHASLSIL